MRYADSNPKSSTPTFHIKWVLNQVSYSSFSVFGELGQFRKTERGRSSQISYKSLARILLRKYFKFFNSTFNLVSKKCSLTHSNCSSKAKGLTSHLHRDIKVYYQQTSSREAGSWLRCYDTLLCWGNPIGQLTETPFQIPQIIWTGIHKQKVIWNPGATLFTIF